ncbi:pilin [Patescibacteria group bacterium]|nr:pilin [Patescibacteria group bacterium]
MKELSLKVQMAFFFLALPFVFFAPTSVLANVERLRNPLQFETLTEFLRRLLEVVALIGFPVIVLFIIYIGFQFITSEGNPEKLTKVRQLFFWALVGALIVLGAQALSIAIQGTVEQLQGGL